MPITKFIPAFWLGAFAVLGVHGMSRAQVCPGNGSVFHPGIAIGVVQANGLDEISGVAASRQNPGVLWVHNDGSTRNLFALNSNGNLLATYEFRRQLKDLEDVAIGPGPVPGSDYLYGGDIGDNDEDRSNIRIFRALEPSVSASPPNNPLESSFTEESIITLEYPDGKHDAEALMVDPWTGDLFIATKGNSVSRIYRTTQAELDSGTKVTLTFVRQVPFDSVSGGDISPDGLEITLRREEAGALWHRSGGQSIGDAFAGGALLLPVIGTPTEPNGEAVAFHPLGLGYFTISEGQNQPVYFFARSEPPVFAQVPARTENGWLLQIQGCPGTAVTIRASTNLNDWETLSSMILYQSTTSYLDSETNLMKRFYTLQKGLQ